MDFIRVGVVLLFLDELGTLSMAAQERLLRVVEYGEVTRIGASKPVRVDVRIVAATNEDLPAAADAGRFRPDLLDRLSFEVITLPPLRAREGDVAVLADHFGRRMAAEINWPQWPGFTAACAAELEGHGWPGNVRELRNVVERAVYRWDDPARPISRITFDPFASPWKPRAMMPRPETREEAPSLPPAAPASLSSPCDGISDLKAAVDTYEAAIVRAALERYRYNQRATAKGLGLTYDQLRHCMKKHDLSAG